MHNPRARIVSLECNHHISSVRKQNNIAARGSVKIQVQAMGKMVNVVLLKNGKVMAMQVDLISGELYEGTRQESIKTNAYGMCIYSSGIVLGLWTFNYHPDLYRH